MPHPYVKYPSATEVELERCFFIQDEILVSASSTSHAFNYISMDFSYYQSRFTAIDEFQRLQNYRANNYHDKCIAVRRRTAISLRNDCIVHSRLERRLNNNPDSPYAAQNSTPPAGAVVAFYTMRKDWMQQMDAAKKAQDPVAIATLCRTHPYTSGRPLAFIRVVPAWYKTARLTIESQFYSGEFKRVCWSSSRFLEQNIEAFVLHFTHQSTEDPKMIAYAPTIRHLKEGRWVKMKPGKYLTKYFSDHLTPEKIKELAERQSGTHESLKLCIFKNGEDYSANEREWIRLYAKVQVDYSCMRGEDAPRVYGKVGNGLGMAYFVHTPTDTLMCRAIVRFDRRPEGEYIRIYPYTDSSSLPQITIENFAQTLEASGMSASPDGLEGIEVSKIEYNGRYVMPYLDRPTQYVDEHPHHFTITRSGDYLCDRTDGYMTDEGRERCSCCGDSMDEDDGSYVDNEGMVCQSCIDRHYTYAYTSRGNQEYISNGEAVENQSDGEWYSEYYADRVLVRTEDGDWYNPDDVCHTAEGFYPLDECQILDHEYDGCQYAHTADAVEVNGEWYHKDDPGIPDEDAEDDTDDTPQPPAMQGIETNQGATA